MSRDPLGQRRSDAVESLDELGGRGVQVDRSGGGGRLLPRRRAALPAFASRASRIDSAALLVERDVRGRVWLTLGRDRADGANAGAECDYGGKKEEGFSLSWRGHARALPAPEEYCVIGLLF